MNHSPWIAQLNRTRPVKTIEGDFETDVVIVGGGIAGVSTAYFLLTQTQKRVMLLEGDKIAHGATGHNAGQVSSDFEISFRELVQRFGIQLATAAQNAIEVEARQLLKQMIEHAQVPITFRECMGYFGIQTLEQVLTDLEDMRIKKQAGLRSETMFILDEWYKTITIPVEYSGLYVLVAREQLAELLQTSDARYIAADTFLSGVLNSALFTEGVFQFLEKKYSDRFIASEGAMVSSIALAKDIVTVCYNSHCIKAKQVVLCTNGFESLSLTNDKEEHIDTSFHEEVYGIVGYMAAYIDTQRNDATVTAYALDHATEENPYYYVTRRPVAIEESMNASLVGFGGPQVFMPDRAVYRKDIQYPEQVRDGMDTFASITYGRHPSEMDYHWHGLMGYTKSKVRLIGPDRHDTKLLYNLGCNGIGILTSIYGGKQIARHVNNEKVAPTIFDPQL